MTTTSNMNEYNKFEAGTQGAYAGGSVSNPESTHVAVSQRNAACVGQPKKPETIQGDLANLPGVFKPYLESRVWLCWSWVWNPKKEGWDKPPRDPGNNNASSKNPDRWFTYSEVLAAYQAATVDGIGISLFGLSNSEIFLDLDDCVTPRQVKLRLGLRICSMRRTLMPKSRPAAVGSASSARATSARFTSVSIAWMAAMVASKSTRRAKHAT